MFEALKSTKRLLIETELKPVQGDRFQPTGFADLGAAVYERPDGTRMLLVESAQSVANRLEFACLDKGGPRLSPELEGLPYVLVKLTSGVETETSSLVEAHRINSPFIISDSGFKKEFTLAAGYAPGKPIDWRKVGAALFKYDPNSLLHGVFMANLGDGRIKVPRMITGFIEAEDVREAASGGVKNNPLDPSGKIRAVELMEQDVYGNVPYARMEYTAAKIRAYFNVDLALLAGCDLGPEAEELLTALGLFKIRRFLNGGLRLRTACDLFPVGEPVVRNEAGFVFPKEPDLLKAVQRGIKACTGKGLFAKPPVTELKTKVELRQDKKGTGGDKKATGQESDSFDEENAG